MFKHVADSLICKQINGSWSLKWRWQTSRAPHSNDFPPQNISQVTEAEERINFKQKAEKSYQDKTTVLVVQDCKSDQTMRGHFHRKKTHTHTHTHIVGDPDQYTDTDHMLGWTPNSLFATLKNPMEWGTVNGRFKIIAYAGLKQYWSNLF